MLHDQPADPDAKRLIALSPKDLSAARRLLRLLLGSEAQASDRPPPAPKRSATGTRRDILLARAKDEFDNRRRRVSAFGPSMFGEAAWDMLLALYIVEVSGQRQTIGSLLQFAGTPISTAQRWLDYLFVHEFVQREAHPTDRRTAFIRLTEKARESLDLYFSETVATAV